MNKSPTTHVITTEHMKTEKEKEKEKQETKS